MQQSSASRPEFPRHRHSGQASVPPHGGSNKVSIWIGLQNTSRAFEASQYGRWPAWSHRQLIALNIEMPSMLLFIRTKPNLFRDVADHARYVICEAECAQRITRSAVVSAIEDVEYATICIDEP